VLDSHLALFPKLSPEHDLQVLRGRLLLQGPAVTLRTVLGLIEAWRKNGAPPAPAKWKLELEAALDQPIEWTGRDPEDAALTGGKVIPTLRKFGKINILLEDAPDGSAGELLIKPSDAKLLPPGKQTLRALLDELSKKTGAQWQIDLGVVTITPKSKK
ncbi:MAG TPA: hypothetical protein VEJ63_03585, partial [Planctomycetota bacterium]|nr:hypothetical protein [Planctomycetota bacterium]